MAKVTGLNDAVSQIGVIQSDVLSLDQIINGYEDDEGQVVQGVVAQLNDLIVTVESLDSKYVSIADFNVVVGNLEEMKANNVNIMEDITEIKDILQWKDIDAQ